MNDVVLKDLKGKTVRGGIVTLSGQAVKVLLRTGSVMLLARLLLPEEFGLVGMVSAVTGAFGLFKDAGLTMLTVQRATISEAQISTLFWINAAVGAMLAILSLAIAPVLVYFYHEPRLFWITAAMSTAFVFSALTAQHQALLQRAMRYTTIAVIEVLAQLAGISVGVGMALSGFGYWALVGMAVSEPAVISVGAFTALRWIPGRPQRGVGIRSMLNFGGTVTLNGLVDYIAYNVDKILLGRLRGAEVLGLYGRAYQLMKMPTDQLNSAVGWVSFTALSRIQDDPDRFRNYFLKGYTLTLAATVPLAIMCALFSEELVHVLLGPKWSDAAVILRYLAPAILAFPIMNPFRWLLIARGQVGRNLRMSLAIAPVLIAGYVIGLAHGPAGVALGFSAALTIMIVPMIAWAIEGTPISSRDIVRVVREPFLSGVVAATVAFGARYFFGHGIAPITGLLLGGIVLLGSYLGMLLYILGQKEMYLDVLRKMRSRSADGENGHE